MHSPATSTTPPAAGQPDRRFHATSLSGRVAPFALGGGGAIAIALIGTSPARPDVFLAGVLISLFFLAVGVLGFVLTLPAWRDTVITLFGIVLVGIFREGAGAAEDGISLIVLIPILWLSVFSTRRVLGAGLVLTAIVLGAPIFVIGGADYPVSDLRHVGIIVMLALFVGFTIQSLVGNIRAQASIIVASEGVIADQALASQAMVDAASDGIVTLDARGQIVGWNHAAHVAFGRSSNDLVGSDFIDVLIAPEDRASVRTGLIRLLAGKGTDRDARFETEILAANGRILPVEVTTTTTTGPDGLRIHAFARDISDRRDAEDAAGRHAAELGRLLSVASELGRNGSWLDDRQAICAAARDLSGADMSLFFELDTARGLLVGTARSGPGPEARDVEVSGQSSMTATAFATGRAEFVSDLAIDPRADHVALAQLGTRSALFQPIVNNGRSIGVLVVFWRATLESLPDRVGSIVALLAAQAAAALDRAELLGRLEDLARTDALTGAANRRALEEVLVRELATADRKSTPLSVVMLDLDRFKAFNDGNGHQAGDRLLQHAATAWQAELRPSDTLARYGGEEFLVVLPDCDEATALQIANRLRAVVPGGQTVSAGVASWSQLESMTQLIARADAALYEAKRAGRDRASVAGGDETEPVGRRER
jgi:diguanylate cyclase (GGDEF)-like protein/PAS domain S-box-containing protein